MVFQGNITALKYKVNKEANFCNNFFDERKHTKINLEENAYKVLKYADRKIIPLTNYAYAQQFCGFRSLSSFT